MRVLENADRFKPRGKFSTWLYTIAHNLCMDELRRQNTSIPAEKTAESPPARDPHDHLLKREDEEAAHQLLAALQPHLRAIVVLRVLHDYSQEETAKIVGVPVGTVKSRLHHALKTIAPNGTEPMNQDHRTIQEIQALLGFCTRSAGAAIDWTRKYGLTP